MSNCVFWSTSRNLHAKVSYLSALQDPRPFWAPCICFTYPTTYSSVCFLTLSLTYDYFSRWQIIMSSWHALCRLRVPSLSLENPFERTQNKYACERDYERLAASLLPHHAHSHARMLTCFAFFPTDFRGKGGLLAVYTKGANLTWLFVILNVLIFPWDLYFIICSYNFMTSAKFLVDQMLNHTNFNPYNQKTI